MDCGGGVSLKYDTAVLEFYADYRETSTCDFHAVNLTPSVTLLTDIKENPDGSGGLPSLYKGETNYYNIDDALLHCCESKYLI